MSVNLASCSKINKTNNTSQRWRCFGCFLPSFSMISALQSTKSASVWKILKQWMQRWTLQEPIDSTFDSISKNKPEAIKVITEYSDSEDFAQTVRRNNNLKPHNCKE